LPEFDGELVLILFSLDRRHQVADAVRFRVYDSCGVLSFKEAISLCAYGVSVQIAKWFGGITFRFFLARLMVHIFHLQDRDSEAVRVKRFKTLRDAHYCVACKHWNGIEIRYCDVVIFHAGMGFYVTSFLVRHYTERVSVTK